MIVRFLPGTLEGTVPGVSSKSMLHRLLLGAALSGEPTEIRFRGLSEDVRATADSLGLFGKRAERDGELIRVGRAPAADRADAGSSGSAFRFLLPLSAALCRGRTIQIHGSAQLAARPISPLYEELRAHGALLSPKGRFPMTVGGRLTGGDYSLPGNISSQYVTGLLLALPLCEEDSRIRIGGRLQSRPYVDMTLECLRAFGITADETAEGFFVPGGQRYQSPGAFVCEGDYSNGAFFLTAGAFSARGVSVGGLRPDSRQGDRAILSVLQEMGARLSREGDTVTVRRGVPRPVSVSAENIPDLVPILALAAAAAPGVTEITGAERLRYKESDRLQSVYALLTALGGEAVQHPGGLTVYGKSGLRGGRVHSFHDHRIAMTAAVAAGVCREPVIVEDFQAVDKSYPDFLRDYALAGGRYEILEA